MQFDLMFPTEKLLSSIIKNLNNADEITILMALVTESGINLIYSDLKKAKNKGKKITFVFGTAMPSISSPAAIRKLFQLHNGNNFNLLFYNNKRFFHPKVYIFRKKQSVNLLFGSSNLTNEGITSNVELNGQITDSVDSFKKRKLSEFINEITSASDEITQKWIDDYENKCKMSQRLFSNYKKETDTFVKKIIQKQHIDLNRWNTLIKALIKYKKTADYKNRKRELSTKISECKRTIGKVSRPSVDKDRWTDLKLGIFANVDHRNFHKTIPNTKNKLKKLNKTLKFLLNEKISLEERLDQLFYGKYHINGASISLLSDILLKYFPNECPVVNGPVVEALEHYGVRYIPTNLTQRYMIIKTIYSDLRKEANYPLKEGYALIDLFMWKKGHKLLFGWS